MATKDELKLEVADLTEALEKEKGAHEETTKELGEVQANFVEAKDKLSDLAVKRAAHMTSKGKSEPVVEKTVKLYWPYNEDTGIGMSPTAYGLKLIKEEKHFYADVPESRVEIELGRKGYRVFHKELPEEG